MTIDYLFLQTFKYILLDLKVKNLNKLKSNACIAASLMTISSKLTLFSSMFLTSHEQIIFCIRTGLLILTISLSEINGKTWKLPTNILHGKTWKLQQTFSMEKRGNYQQPFYNTLLSI